MATRSSLFLLLCSEERWGWQADTSLGISKSSPSLTICAHALTNIRQVAYPQVRGSVYRLIYIYYLFISLIRPISRSNSSTFIHHQLPYYYHYQFVVMAAQVLFSPTKTGGSRVLSFQAGRKLPYIWGNKRSIVKSIRIERGV
eukprot:GHVU01029923.1.p1 GENE.GHVU01029923.1~~GHVU01029923.1.p1  ORF type:complete len:143 (-),score=1.98 GHVU01029923.1:442-870(-)